MSEEKNLSLDPIAAEAMTKGKAFLEGEKVELQFSTEPPPEFWFYEPQEDITIRELALLLPMFCGMKSDRTFEYLTNLPEECKRHFRRAG